MVVEMKKYGFLIYHKEYIDFLRELQELGIIHTLQQHNRLDNQEIEGAREFVNKIDETLRYLKRRKPKTETRDLSMTGAELVEDITNQREKLTKLEKKQTEAQLILKQALPWGDYDPDHLDRLRQHHLYVHFFSCKKSQFKPEWQDTYALEIIYQDEVDLYFVILSRKEKAPALERAIIVNPPVEPLHRLKEKADQLALEIRQIQHQLDIYIVSSMDQLEAARQEVLNKLSFDQTLINTESSAGGEVMMLEGFVPVTQKKKLENFLKEKDIFYIEEDPSEQDPVPILLYSNGWSRLFQPITKLFSLPSYGEMDLTPFFAPFFLLFFGFCLGDAGYGLLILMGSFIYYYRTHDPDQKNLLRLAQLLGIGTTLFGTLTGTFFGLQLAEVSYFQDVRDNFLNYDQILVLSMILGIIQILFGISLKAYQKFRWRKYFHALADFGWIILIFSILDMYQIKAIPSISGYAIWAGLVLILLYSKPDAPILERLGAGVWGLYNITGIFGDVLSYIRLFALGVSSSILGLVINNIALEFSSTPYVGPILLVIILIFGHSINILISSLGAFVHPLRLTFVEFYKNAGFTGGGVPYQPFSKRNKS